MSVNEQHVRCFETSNEECCREVRNNNRHAEKSLDGDANANEIQKVDGGTLVVVGTSSSMGYLAEEQVKIVIQCTDSPCEDPELAEFEMLESQELENEDKNTSPKDVKMGPLSKTIPETNKQDSTLCLQSSSKEILTSIAQTEVNSENDIFESCFSTMSSLGESFASAQDHISRTQSSTSWHASSGLYRILSEDLTLASQSCLSDKSQSTQHTDAMHQHPGKNTMHMGSVDLNLNSTTLPEEPLLEAQQHQPATDFITCKSSDQSIDGMRECSIVRIKKVGNESGSAGQDNAGKSGVPVMTEDKDSNLKKIYTETNSCHTVIPDDRSSCDRKYSHDCIDDRKTKFESFHGESSDMNLNPSQPTNSGGCEPQPYKKQASFEKTRSSSSLERRKPWGSPYRHETPQSPKPTSSPRKQPPASPARTISTRESSQECSETFQKGISSLKQPSKSFLRSSSSSSIPKPALPQQPRTESERNKSSPPQKPKNVRPKIITYVRKNPQVKPMSEGPYEVSTLPPRLTPYVSSPAPKEPKPESARGSPVLSSSNILCDMYRQDTQRSGYYSPPGVSGIRPTSHNVSHKLIGKSDSFHGELPDESLHEVGISSQGKAKQVYSNSTFHTQ